MKILASLFIALFAVTAFGYTNGQVQNAPYNQALQKLIDFSQLDGQHVERTVKATWDFAKYGGSTAASINLGQYLPANATIKRSYAYVVTQVAGGTSMRVSCANAGDILATADKTGSAAGAFFEGASTGTAATFKDVGTSRCQVYVDFLNSAPATAGKVNFYLDYFSHD